MRPYDTDLRERVVRAVHKGSSIRAAALRFEVHPTTAGRWLERLEAHGELDPAARPLRGSVLDEHADWLAELRADDPALSCRVICERLAEERGLEVHETTLWYWLRRHGFTHKKTR